MGKLSANAETVKGPGFDTTVGKMKDMGYSADDISKLNPQTNGYQKAFKVGMSGLAGAVNPSQNMFYGGNLPGMPEFGDHQSDDDSDSQSPWKTSLKKIAVGGLQGARLDQQQSDLYSRGFYGGRR